MACPFCTELLVPIPYGPEQSLINTCSLDAPLFLMRTFFARRPSLLQQVNDNDGVITALRKVMAKLIANDFTGVVNVASYKICKSVFSSITMIQVVKRTG